MISVLVGLSVLLCVGVASGVNWDFVKCGRYPQDASGVTGSPKCSGVITKFVKSKTIDAQLQSFTSSGHDGKNLASDLLVDLVGYQQSFNCSDKSVKIPHHQHIGNDIHTSFQSAGARKCYQHYGGRIVTKDTPSGGYARTSESCRESARVMKCTSGIYHKCGVKADLTFSDAKGNKLTHLLNEKIPTSIDFYTVPCQSICRRYASTCCAAGYVGRNHGAAIHAGDKCEAGKVSPMYYYDASWVESHGHCDKSPVAFYEKSFKVHGGTAHIKTRCFDPICDHKDTADIHCNPSQLLSTDNKGSPKSVASSISRNTFGFGLVSVIAFCLL